MDVVVRSRAAILAIFWAATSTVLPYTNRSSQALRAGPVGSGSVVRGRTMGNRKLGGCLV